MPYPQISLLCTTLRQQCRIDRDSRLKLIVGKLAGLVLTSIAEEGRHSTSELVVTRGKESQRTCVHANKDWDIRTVYGGCVTCERRIYGGRIKGHLSLGRVETENKPRRRVPNSGCSRSDYSSLYIIREVIIV